MKAREIMILVACGAVVLAPYRARGADGAAAMRVYRDPETGAFTTPPAASASAPAAEDTTPRAYELGTSGEALVEEPGASAAGGMTIDLRGRFRSVESATVDGAGTVRGNCHTVPDSKTPR